MEKSPALPWGTDTPPWQHISAPLRVVTKCFPCKNHGRCRGQVLTDIFLPGSHQKGLVFSSLWGGVSCFGCCSELPADREDSPRKPSHMAGTASSQAGCISHQLMFGWISWISSSLVGHPRALRQNIRATQIAQMPFLLMRDGPSEHKAATSDTHSHPPCNHLPHPPERPDLGGPLCSAELLA